MAEPRNDDETSRFEGWAVNERPAVLGGLAASFGLLALVAIGSYVYTSNFRQLTQVKQRAFPEPQLERHLLAPREAGRAATRPDPADPAIERAMRDVAGEPPQEPGR